MYIFFPFSRLNSSCANGDFKLYKNKRFTEEQREAEVKQEQLKYENRDHALFIAFAPVSDPKYAISVVVEHGGSGSKAAAPIAKKVIKKVLERDQLRENVKSLTGEEI